MNEYKIALLGDTTIEHWGPDCPQLKRELSRLFAYTQFEIENHGLAGARVGLGLYRVSHDYHRNGEVLCCLSDTNPQVVVVDSFAYTQFVDGPEGLTEYRDLLRRLWDEIGHTTKASRLLCLTIPPDRERFLSTLPAYFHTSKALRQRMADDVRLYLDEARVIAQDEGWPLADVQSEVEKLIAAGEPARRFINQADNQHPSAYGYEIQARMLVRALDNHRMVEEIIEK